jgi:hypothetical protein
MGFNLKETFLRARMRGQMPDFDPTTVTTDMNGIMHAADAIDYEGLSEEEQSVIRFIRSSKKKALFIGIETRRVKENRVEQFYVIYDPTIMGGIESDFPIPDDPQTIEVKVDDEFLTRIHESKEYQELLGRGKIDPRQTRTLAEEREYQELAAAIGPEKNFTVLKPAHYNSTKISTWNIVEDWGLTYHIGNAIKYIQRAGKKPGSDWFDDMGKAIESIQEEIRLRRKGNG